VTVAAVLAIMLVSPPPLRVETDLCAYAVELDQKRISRERVEAFFRLWERSAGGWLGELMDASLGAGESSDAPEKVVQLEEAVLARFETSMKKARPPPSLDPVVEYTREWIEFEIWEDRALRDFCATKDASALRRPFRGVRPAEACAKVIEEVSSKWFGKCEAARLRWGNCVVHARGTREFPAAAWERFKQEHGIRLRELHCDEP
jgi:hypothetical protein